LIQILNKDVLFRKKKQKAGGQSLLFIGRRFHLQLALHSCYSHFN